MTGLVAEFEAFTDVAFRAGRDTRTRETLAFMPGSTVRGALAAAHQLLRPDQQTEFAEFFLKDEIQFGCAWPCKVEDAKPDRDHPPLIVRPLPRTALTCKRCGGFDCGDDERHGVRDSLIDMLLLRHRENGQREIPKRLNVCGYRESCPAPLQRSSGFYRRAGAGGYGAAAAPRKMLHTRVGISRARGTAQQGVVYSVQQIAKGSRFQTVIRAGQHKDALAAFITEASEAGFLRVGRSRSRGGGRLHLVSLTSAPAEETPTVGDRLTAFNQALQQAADEDQVTPLFPVWLPVTLESDVICLDRFLRFAGTLDAEWLAAATGLTGASLLHQDAATELVTGWNEVAGLPKHDAWAIAKGSVFVFGLSTMPDADALARLAQVEDQGTGERRAEGFGRVRFAIPFHTEAAAA